MQGILRLNPVQVAHTRLLHYKHTRQAKEVTHTLADLGSRLVAAYSEERVMGKRAGLASQSAHLRQSIQECAELESEHYLQLQQAFCLQVPSLCPLLAIKYCLPSVPVPHWSFCRTIEHAGQHGVLSWYLHE